MSLEPAGKITLTREDERWVVLDEATGVASQGETREEALRLLDEAVALHTGKIGEPVEDEEAFLQEIGIDPKEIDRDRDLPEFIQ
jgi:predicted RNase H-like HicB family nuclease